MSDRFATAESRRRFGEGLWSYDPDVAMRTLATADCMDAGTYDAFKDARAQWEAAEPSPIDFLPAEQARALLARRDEEVAKRAAERKSMWGNGS